jgi:poly(glycerol-phosphate) alpha-glucosyltransferase
MNLVHAWSKVQRDCSKLAEGWVLVIAGMDEGGHEATIRQRVKELRLEKTILFPGQQYGPAKTSLFNSASAFILPSFSEGLPMGILDAWAHWLPVLMTPQCNLPEGFTANAAIRIEPSTESIGRGLEDLFRHPPSALQTLGNNGRQLVSEKFTWSRVASQMRDVYDWLLGGGEAPECVQISRLS